MRGSGVYVGQSSSQRALSPEDVAPAADLSPYQSDIAGLEDQLAPTQGLHSLHVQAAKLPARLSREISLSSDSAQNTCLPGVGQPERKSLGEDSVNDYAVKPDETMDDILRFFLKVWPSATHRLAFTMLVCACMHACVPSMLSSSAACLVVACT